MITKDEAQKYGVSIIDTKAANNPLFEALRANFPQTIKDGTPDFVAIATLLGLPPSAQKVQGYELTFTGKPLANELYASPCEKMLKWQENFAVGQTAQNQGTQEQGEQSTPPNALIIGDNLDALKILRGAYSEKVKMIYIDPPYNTKNENFIYPDNFRDDYKRILENLGLIEIDEDGNEKESEALLFFKNIQGSRTHSGWLAFMLPRLKLARDLLKDDGVIFISIDDHEQANLKILCDVGEQSDRNKLGGIEYKSREGQADEGEPVFECHISNSLSVIYTFRGTKLWNLSDNGIL